MSGWYATKRGTLEHPLFAPEGPFSRYEAWHWMIERAAWKPTNHRIGGVIHDVPRGAFFCTLRELRDAWGWGSDKRVRLFLEALERERTIGRKTDAGKTLITLCNYDKYNFEPAGQDAKRTQAGRSEDALKEQVNNSSKEDAPRQTLKQRVWSEGVRILLGAGLKERNARSLLGKWVKAHGEAEVMAALLSAEDRADPVAFVEGRLRKAERAQSSEDDRLAAWGIRDDGHGDTSGGGHQCAPAQRDAANDMPPVFAYAAEEVGPMPERDVQAGRGGFPLLALRVQGGRLQ